MRMITRIAALLVLGTLGACGSGKDAAPQQGAETQILPGSASDAMLPYDTVTSAPPLEAPVTAPARSGSEADRPAAAGTEQEAAPDATTVPDPMAT